MMDVLGILFRVFVTTAPVVGILRAAALVVALVVDAALSTADLVETGLARDLAFWAISYRGRVADDIAVSRWSYEISDALERIAGDWAGHHDPLVLAEDGTGRFRSATDVIRADVALLARESF